MHVFVTGGTGLLGNTILRQLTEAGHHALALVRGQPDPKVFEGIDAEFVTGDLLDHDAVDDAVSRCQVVIHAAGVIHLGWSRLEESMRVNRDGTKVIAEACLRHDRKLVHVGTVDAIALGSKHQPADETTPLENQGGQVLCNYVVSKRAGLEEVKQRIARGLQAVVVHPGFMLGPWDWKPSSGRMMLEVGRGWKPIAPSGGCSVCDARDVATGTITAATTQIESGRQFILAGENWTYLDLWAAMAKRMHARGPLIPAGPLQRWIGAVAGDLWTKVATESDLNSAAVAMSSQYHWYNSARARSELGYQTRDVHRSLDEAAAWLRANHR